MAETLTFVRDSVPSGSLTNKGPQIFGIINSTLGEKPRGCMIVVDRQEYPDIEPGDSIAWNARAMSMRMPESKEVITYNSNRYDLYYLTVRTKDALVKKPAQPAADATAASST